MTPEQRAEAQRLAASPKLATTEEYLRALLAVGLDLLDASAGSPSVPPPVLVAAGGIEGAPADAPTRKTRRDNGNR